MSRHATHIMDYVVSDPNSKLDYPERSGTARGTRESLYRDLFKLRTIIPKHMNICAFIKELDPL